jgi:hypothetical protein
MATKGRWRKPPMIPKKEKAGWSCYFTRFQHNNGSREYAPNERLSDASRRMKPSNWKMF